MSIDMPYDNDFVKILSWLITFFPSLKRSNRYFKLFLYSHGFSVVYDGDK